MTQEWSQKPTGHIPPYMKDVKIGPLIGLNCPDVFRPKDVIYGEENEPYAVKLLLG